MNGILISELVSALKDANGIVEHLRLTDHDGVENIDQEPLAGAQERIRAAIALSEIHAPMTETPTDALRLVPVEPTEAMLQAAYAAYVETPSGEGLEDFHAAWSAAISAAPASPLPGGGQLSKNLGQLNPELFAENANQIGQCSGISGELSGWHTNFDDAPKDGRWIVTLDKWRNAETMQWSKEVSRLLPENGERGWVAKGGYSPRTRPELSVAWALLPAAPTGAK